MGNRILPELPAPTAGANCLVKKRIDSEYDVKNDIVMGSTECESDNYQEFELYTVHLGEFAV